MTQTIEQPAVDTVVSGQDLRVRYGATAVDGISRAIRRGEIFGLELFVTHIYAKLGVNDRAAAVAEAFDRGLLIPRHLSS